MHKNDQMTSNERLTAYFEGEEVDRLPAMPMVDSFGCKIAGHEMRYKRQSAENQVEVQKACYDLLGLDGLSIEYGLHGIGQACGTVLNDPPNATPFIVSHRMKSLDEVDDLDTECVRRIHDPWMELCCRACEMLVDQMGEEVGTSAALTGPLTVAASLYPIGDLLVAMRKQPDKVRKLLRFSTDALKIICDEFAATGVASSSATLWRQVTSSAPTSTGISSSRSPRNSPRWCTPTTLPWATTSAVTPTTSPSTCSNRAATCSAWTQRCL